MKDEDYSLGEEQNDFSLGLKNDATKENTKKIDKLKPVTIEEFYDLLVKDWSDSRSASYEVYLQQGNISSDIIYHVLGLETFQVPTEEDIKRLEELKLRLLKDAEKFQKVDMAKRDDLVDAIGFLFANFQNVKRNQQFVDILKKSTWNRLTVVISDKCSDGVVELGEMVDIYKVATDLGLFTDKQRSETINEINKIIKESGAKIETLADSFKGYFNDYVKQNPNNDIDNKTNRANLLRKYKELKNLECQILGKNNVLTEDEYKKDFSDFLTSCNIKLVSPVERFNSDFFNNFKQTHDLTKSLSAIDYANLKSEAATYGIVGSDWDNFEHANNITIEKSISREDIDKVVKEQLSKNNVQKQNKKNNKILFIIIGIVAVLAIFFVIFGITKNSSNNGNGSNAQQQEINENNKQLKASELLKIVSEYMEQNLSKTVLYNKVLADGNYTEKELNSAVKKLNIDWKICASNKFNEYFESEIGSRAYFYDKLVTDDRFTEKEADYALDNAGVSWEQMAIEKSKEYVKKGYSDDAVYDSLLNVDKFTSGEAKAVKNKLKKLDKVFKKVRYWTNDRDFSKQETYDKIMDTSLAVNHGFKGKGEDVELALELLDVDWKEHAYKRVVPYKGEHYNYDMLIKCQFTEEEAQYAIDKHDWKKMALDFIEHGYKTWVPTKEEIFNKLVKEDGFSEEAAQYAIDNM